MENSEKQTMTLILKNNRWYLVTPRGTEVKTQFFAKDSEERVIAFFKRKYGLKIENRQKVLC